MKMNRKGFTLVELMVVLAILGILAGIGIPSYMNVLDRARVGTDIAKIAQVQTNINAFVAEIGGWGNALTGVSPGTAANAGDIVLTVTGIPAAPVNTPAIYGKSIITGGTINLAIFFDANLGTPQTIMTSNAAKAAGNVWYIDTTGKVFVGKADGTRVLP